MKDITDYFRMSNKNALMQTPDPIPKSQIPLYKDKSNNCNNDKKEKRKIETTSESEAEITSTSLCSKYKRMSLDKNDPEEKKLFVNNVHVRLTNIDKHLTKQKEPQVQPTNGAYRELRVVLEDCSMFFDIKKLREGKRIKFDDNKSKIVDHSPKKKFIKKKRRPVIMDSSSSNETDSEHQIFREISKSSKASSGSRKYETPLNSIRNDDSSLFSNFKTNESSMLVDDSPVKAPHIISVVAQIHSPPKPRFKEHKLNDEVKENQSPIKQQNRASIMKENTSPIVKIVRTDVNKPLRCDEIEVISTEIIDLEQSPSLSKSDGADSSDDFVPVREKTLPSWKMRVQFASTNLKHTKIVKKYKPKDEGKKNSNESRQSKKKTKAKYSSQSSIDTEASETEIIGSPSVSLEGTEISTDVKINAEQNSSKMNSNKVHVSSNGSKQAAKEIKSLHSAEEMELNENSNGAKEEAKLSSRSLKAAKKEMNKQSTKSEPKKLNESTIVAKEGTSLGSRSSKVSKNKPNEKSTKTEPRKLAPLFCKQYDIKKKSSELNVNDEAKKLFLKSGVPDVIKKKMEEQKSFIKTDSYAGEYIFPSKTHIQQRDASCFVWNLEKIPDLLKKPEDEVISFSKEDKFLRFIDEEESLKTNTYKYPDFDIKDEIAALKKMEPNVNVANIFSSVKRLYKETKDSDGTMCWTEKYKPISAEDVIGNAISLSKLREWIESHKRIRFKSTEAENSSSEEFIDSDDSCSESVRNNLAILVGPSGCGKTCSVYALANELGFKVLEVNAASNRNGKRILEQLLEATQSHRVKRTSIFDKAEAKKSKKKKKEDKREKKTMSLILIEDADVLFEKFDEGFQSALSSLTSQSKRPLIFVINNINYPHLVKYNNPRNLILKFTYPSRSLLNVWLQSIALIEGVKLTDEVFLDLFNVAGLDIRKSLLQLQLLISTKKYSRPSAEYLFYTDWLKRISHLEINDNSTKCQPRRSKIFSDDEESSAEENIHQICEETSLPEKSGKESEADLESLQKCSTLLEKIAFLDDLRRNITHPGFVFPGEGNAVECLAVNNYYSELNNNIADCMAKQIFLRKDWDTSFSFREYYSKIRKSNEVKELCENIFCSCIPRPTNGISKYCDYLWAIREIARCDRSKMSGNTKRTSRFFSYLKSINVNVSNAEAKILCQSLTQRV